MTDLYSIPNCKRNIEGYEVRISEADKDINEADSWDYIVDRYEQYEWAAQNLRRWEVRLHNAILEAVMLWENVMVDYTDKQLLMCMTEYNPYQGEAADRLLNRPHRHDSNICDNCGGDLDDWSIRHDAEIIWRCDYTGYHQDYVCSASEWGY